MLVDSHTNACKAVTSIPLMFIEFMKRKQCPHTKKCLLFELFSAIHMHICNASLQFRQWHSVCICQHPILVCSAMLVVLLLLHWYLYTVVAFNLG